MRVVVITPPEPVVSLAETKLHLRVEHDVDDALIEGLMAAATANIDGPDGWLGRCIGEQTLEAGLDGFVYDPIALPFPPIIDVEGIRYEAVGGGWHDVDPAVFEIRDGRVGTAWGKSWPSTRRYRGASRTVLIRYRAGYDTVPAPIRVAILMMVATMYERRGTNAPDMPAAAATLLGPYRVFL